MPREASSQFEAGVRELVARISQFELRLKREEEMAGEAWQRLLLFQPGWMRPAPPPPPPPPPTTFSGVLHGCNGIALMGETVTIKDHATGSTMATATTDSAGAYSGAITLATSPQSVDVVTAVSRFNATTTNRSFSTGANAVPTISLTADSTHVCLTGCSRPAAKTLHGTNSKYGAYTLVYSATFNNWSVTTTQNYAGAITPSFCPAANPVTVSWTLTAGGGLTVTWSCVNAITNFCPTTSTATFCHHSPTQTSLTCPPMLNIAFTDNNINNTLYYPSGATDTITE